MSEPVPMTWHEIWTLADGPTREKLEEAQNEKLASPPLDTKDTPECCMEERRKLLKRREISTGRRLGSDRRKS